MFRLFPRYFWEFLVGACRPIRQILTLFQTKKNDIFHTRFKTWGPFLEAPGNYRARKAVLFSILEGSFRSFENYTVELLANETKWTSLEDRTHPTFLETLIQKYDSGPVKLPGLSRNGPLASKKLCHHYHHYLID